jgi:hypothetical protein
MAISFVGCKDEEPEPEPELTLVVKPKKKVCHVISDTEDDEDELEKELTNINEPSQDDHETFARLLSASSNTKVRTIRKK